ncbi:MAG TPA: beta-galactosidase GalB [Chthoniobacteraceae bacterium]|jgi:beta-galactosidase|nr:beta-galactosidase GalB [Chthoniobacteraceae bacterium]
MKKCFNIAAAMIALGATALAQTAPPRERLSMDSGWRFTKDDPAGVNGALDYSKVKPWVMATGADLTESGSAAPMPAGNPGGDVAYTQPGFNDSGWRLLNLPHDWGVEGQFNQAYPGETGKLPWWGVGWYRKHFTVSTQDQAKQLYLDVDGAMSHAMVWLNGKFVGGWPYGYASWELDLTRYIQPGDNVIAIRLDNPKDSSRWYPGGGIDRNVWLVKTEPEHIDHWGVFVTTPDISPASATVKVAANVKNPSGGSVITQIFAADANGAATGPHLASAQPIPVAASTDAQLQVPNPRLWSLDHPNLYVAVTSIVVNRKLVDQVQTPFGIRTARFDPDKGFLLNGEHVHLNGVCDHSDLGALGSAVYTRGLQRQLEILREMGCNAIRTSHNPPSPELLNLCDRMGFLVMDEFADCWSWGKKPNDYHLLFHDWHEKDLRALVRRDRNHPCVILWSIGNEIPEQGAPIGATEAKMLTAIVHQEDATRPTTAACSDVAAGYNGFENGLDVMGYNYKPGEYAKFHKTHPEQPIFGSETASCISSRGEYFFPVAPGKAGGGENFQMSSYDLYAPGWATPPDWEFASQDKNPFVAGEFVWTGFDYLGEPTPYNSDMSNLLNFHTDAEKAQAEEQLKALGKIPVPSRSSYFGIIDLAGFKKDRFYLYQAHWRPDYPMAHILPHWNWPERVGQVTPVFVYTSGDEAELFLNGKSLGRKKKGQYEYRLRWDDVVYQPGELHVVAYKNGEKWAEDTVKTTGPAAKVTLQPDRAAIKADGQDLSYVTVSIADKDGLMVPRSNNLVQFHVTGPAEIVAVDNGDATSHQPFHAQQITAFNGLALVILRGKPGEPGTATLSAQSAGLAPASVTVRTQ